jgi:hypothetical protein
MKNKFNAVAVICSAFVALLTGCANLSPVSLTFESTKMSFMVIKTGCAIRSGEYRDLSGKGNSVPMMRFVAYDESNATVGEWLASCNAVIPNGVSQCKVSGDILVPYTALGGPGCPNLKKFRSM